MEYVWWGDDIEDGGNKREIVGIIWSKSYG